MQQILECKPELPELQRIAEFANHLEHFFLDEILTNPKNSNPPSVIPSADEIYEETRKVEDQHLVEAYTRQMVEKIHEAKANAKYLAHIHIPKTFENRQPLAQNFRNRGYDAIFGPGFSGYDTFDSFTVNWS